MTTTSRRELAEAAVKLDPLIPRHAFRAVVLLRNLGKCIIPECGLVAADAHHILNRNLYTDPDELGGYFYSNGVALCEGHHLDAERNKISVPTLSKLTGMPHRIPNSFNPDHEYDTWGNDRTTMTRGPLWDEPGCQMAMYARGTMWSFN